LHREISETGDLFRLCDKPFFFGTGAVGSVSNNIAELISKSPSAATVSVALKPERGNEKQWN
jgi:hypothetical protein